MKYNMTSTQFKRGVICKYDDEISKIDAFNFNLKKKIFPGEHAPGPP